AAIALARGVEQPAQLGAGNLQGLFELGLARRVLDDVDAGVLDALLVEPLQRLAAGRALGVVEHLDAPGLAHALGFSPLRCAGSMARARARVARLQGQAGRARRLRGRACARED